MQHDECTKCHCIVHFKMFKTVHSHIFCHNTKKAGDSFAALAASGGSAQKTGWGSVQPAAAAAPAR